MKKLQATKSTRLIGWAVVVVLVAGAVLGWLYSHTKVFAPADRAAAEATLHYIHQLDSDWNAGVMAARVGINDSYDAIVEPLARIRDAVGKLENGAAASDPALRSQLAALRQAVSKKSDLVDAFKSRNSVLRNSLRYLPLAAADAKGEVGANADQIDAALREALTYSVSPDKAQQERLGALIKEIEGRAAAARPEAEMDPIINFTNHLWTVYSHVPERATLLTSILNVPTATTIDAAAQGYDRHFTVQSRQAEIWHMVLAGYAAILLGGLTYGAIRLRQSYRQMSRMNATLRNANDGLHRRVTERTNELAAAVKSLRKSEAQLVQSEKMSSLGQMVAGMAREMHTPLSHVRSNIETVRKQLEEFAGFVRVGARLHAGLQTPAPPEESELEESLWSLSTLMANLADDKVLEDMARLADESLQGLDQIGELMVNVAQIQAPETQHDDAL
jgi:signal transduction histidine kinase